MGYLLILPCIDTEGVGNLPVMGYLVDSEVYNL